MGDLDYGKSKEPGSYLGMVSIVISPFLLVLEIVKKSQLTNRKILGPTLYKLDIFLLEILVHDGPHLLIGRVLGFVLSNSPKNDQCGSLISYETCL